MRGIFFGTCTEVLCGNLYCIYKSKRCRTFYMGPHLAEVFVL